MKIWTLYISNIYLFFDVIQIQEPKLEVDVMYSCSKNSPQG